MNHRQPMIPVRESGERFNYPPPIRDKYLRRRVKEILKNR